MNHDEWLGARRARALTIQVRPVVSLAERRMVTVDILPQWKRPGAEVLEGPALWSLVRSTEDLRQLCGLLTEQLADCWKAWYQAGLAPRLSLPLTLRALSFQTGAAGLPALLLPSGMPAGKLEVRLAEQEIGRDLHEGGQGIARLRDMGVKTAAVVAGRARRAAAPGAPWPLDALWIWPDFVSRADPADLAQDIDSSLAALAGGRPLPVVAQGIATEAQWHALQGSRCTAIQGDWVAAPMRAADLLDWVYANRWHRQMRAELPRHLPPAAPQPLARAQDLAILIVDDDPLTRRILRRQLAQLGMSDCEEAGDGAQARRLLDGRPEYSVIFCDLKMPGMDGIEFLRYAAERVPGVRVVLISGTDEKILRSAAALARAHGLRVLGTLGKPIRMFRLRLILDRLQQEEEPQGAAHPVAVGPEDFAAALAAGAIRPHFQPKVSVATGALIGAEALLRWEHAEGLLMPGQILPLAQSSGRMSELTGQMIRASLAALAGWQVPELQVGVSVNLTMDVLRDLDFPERLTAWCAENGVAPEALLLEVTETSALRDPVTTLDVATRLRMRGFTLSIDDFGTGHSSLRQLRDIPFNEIKIDQSFVSISHLDGEARRIVENTVRLAQSLGMRSVAEGVETADEWELLRELGCDALQGFYVSRAMPPEAFLDWWRNDYGPRLQRGELPPA